ncbi:MAG: histidinol phosphate phosphatase domain-containing protein [Candidatus Methanoliparum thermophilum]|uniref:Histidinol phosphate phosphatase domain-containing protein n=1 Tax=Methanoliparum thermophilum TaxID=2491083 RepID=A0A520KRV4_METT2|nr:histidinol phosphate phosphatase domain-containing protein [Candidatus Methanoliparum sp. LAM-1]RZN64147.1 MAG: histidinol phosphate phosphatase domain-containing protein [Candidatus Methanoliparum thermophilum]BDC35584.1 PHP domain-containing protein [Candidatus Methanoliparum sp. LAM-1]
MFDYHTHTIFSDGDLIPSELVKRATKLGNEGIALTDHVDFSNYDFILRSLLNAKNELKDDWEIFVLVGVEITHVPPNKIDKLVKKTKKAGAEIIVVHGESIVEPVANGTNKAAVSNEKVDILAHPGLITEDEVELARENDVLLEITARTGHSLTNGHVASLAKKIGANVVINSDAHSPNDLINDDMAMMVLMGAGLDKNTAKKILEYGKEYYNKM